MGVTEASTFPAGRTRRKCGLPAFGLDRLFSCWARATAFCAAWRSSSWVGAGPGSSGAARLLQDAMQRLRAPGVRGTSGGSPTVLGWAYIDTGRWDEALDVAAEAAGIAEANNMDIVAASASAAAAAVPAEDPRRVQRGRLTGVVLAGPAQMLVTRASAKLPAPSS
jgi:hypothetical protein